MAPRDFGTSQSAIMKWTTDLNLSVVFDMVIYQHQLIKFSLHKKKLKIMLNTIRHYAITPIS